MTARDTGIDVLDARFPIRVTMPASIFWDMAHLRPDRAALGGLNGLATRARADEAQHQERFVAPQPRFVPEQAHEDTAVDMALPRGWYKDTAAREGMPQPEDTGTFIVAYGLAEKAEVEAAARRPWHRARRAIARLTTTKGESSGLA